MSDARKPELLDLVGEVASPDEQARLARVHELLLRADPPPDVEGRVEGAALHRSPARARRVARPRRRVSRLAASVAGALCLLAAFGAGYVVGDRPAGVVRTIHMEGAGASASIALLAADEAGNWPMTLTVRGLPPGEYELWLTRSGRLVAECGPFRTGRGTTKVPLNAPYRLRSFDGWVVVRAGSSEPLLST